MYACVWSSRRQQAAHATAAHDTAPALTYPSLYLSCTLSLVLSLSQVDKKAGKAKELVVEYGSKAYEQAKTSQLAAKASEAAAQGLKKASAAYEQVAANPAVQQIAVKGGELASQARAKVAEQLVKARGESPAPALNGTV